MASFQTIVANDLEEVRMIAGDTKTFTYTVYDENNQTVSLLSASPVVYIFRYGEVTVLETLLGTVTPLPTVGEFKVTLPASVTINLSGIYQQQVEVTDSIGNRHRPSQGRIIIFPSPYVET